MATKKPSHEEEDYFARVEIDKRRALADKLKEQMAQGEIEKLKQLHWMHCAKCGFELHSIVFKGITIEKCPNCGGIFLDAGELERLVGKEGGFVTAVLSLFDYSNKESYSQK